MKNSYLKMFVVVAALALAVPGAALGKGRPEGKGDKGKGHAPKTHLATANVKGTVTANDGSTMTVTVEKASGHVKACKGQALTFDVSKARVHVADNDADGDRDAADVLVGHKVKVQGKVALTKGRKVSCGVTEGQVLPARQVNDRTKAETDDTDDSADDDAGTEGQTDAGDDTEDTVEETPAA